MKKLDQISGVFLLALGIFIGIESYREGLGELHNPGPGFFPFLTALAVLGLSLALLVQSVKAGTGEQAIFWESREKILQVVLCVLSVPAYGFFLEKIGFVFCTLLFIGFTAKAIAGMKWSGTLILAALSSLGAYVVFQLLLKSDLPVGFWGM